MASIHRLILAGIVVLALSISIAAQANNYSKAIETFKKSPAVTPFFYSAYGYAVFPTIGKVESVLEEHTVKGRCMKMARSLA